MAFKIRDDGGCGHYNTRFSGRYQYINNLLKKKKKGIRLQIFKFFGGWVWGEG